MTGALDPVFLGFGLTRSFRRNQADDFVSAGGRTGVIAAVGQIIGTRGSNQGSASQGELLWRTDFGSLVHLLRHAPNSTSRRELGRTYVTDALKKWEPRIIVKSVDVEEGDAPAGKGRVMTITVTFNFISTNVPGNRVVFAEDLIVQQQIPIAS